MDNKRLIIAIALSLVVMLGWNYLFPPPAPTPTTTENAAPAEEKAQAPQAEAPAPVVPGAPAMSSAAFVPDEVSLLKVDTPLYSAALSERGGVLQHFQLKKYRQTLDKNSPEVDLISDTALAMAPLGILLNGQATWRDFPWTSQSGDLDLKAGEIGTIVLDGVIGGQHLQRTLTFSADTYEIKDTVRLVDPAPGAAAATRVGFTLSSGLLGAKDDRYNITTVVALNADGLDKEEDTDDLGTGQIVGNGIQWAGIMNNYFLLAVAPSSDDTIVKRKYEGETYRVALEKTGLMTDSGDPSYNVTYFLGPKERSRLEAAPNELARAADLGFFHVIGAPLLTAMNFFYHYTGNYGVAIILLTVIIKVVLFPLSYKSYKSMEQMKKIQPMMAKVREKYKDDKQRMQQEMMSLYKTYKVNPAGGCLPMALQIPVFIGLYQALLNAIELRHAAFIPYVPFTDIPWLADLSAQDPFYVTPLIMGATMFLQQKLTPQPGDPTQAKIMMLMPVVFTFLFLSFPAGLVVYWLVNNVLSIAQQWWMLRSK